MKDKEEKQYDLFIKFVKEIESSVNNFIIECKKNDTGVLSMTEANTLIFKSLITNLAFLISNCYEEKYDNELSQSVYTELKMLIKHCREDKEKSSK